MKIAILFLTLASNCQALDKSASGTITQTLLALPKGGPAVAVQLTEYHRGSKREIAQDPLYEPINPDGTLVVTFPPPQTALFQQSYPEWEQLNDLMNSLNDLIESRKQHADLMLAVESGHKHRLAEFEASSKAFDAKYDAFDTRVRQILGEPIYIALDDKTVELAATGAGFIQILGDWIKQRREELSRQTASIVTQAKSSATITIQAFHTPTDGTAIALHVDPYDNIPSGSLSSDSKTDIGLSAVEYAKLRKGYELAESVAQGISLFRQNLDAIRETLQKLADTTTERLLKGFESINTRSLLWSKRLSEAETLLGDLSKEPEPVGGKAKQLMESLGAIRQDINRINEITIIAKDLKDQGRRGRILDLFLGDKTQISSLIERSGAVLEASKTWPTLTVSLREQIQGLIAVVPVAEKDRALKGLGELKNDVLVQIDNSRTAIESLIPLTLQSLQEGKRVANQTKDDEAAYAKMSSARVEPIPHGLDDLVPGRIELKSARIEAGDGIKIRVTIQDPTTQERRFTEYHLTVRHVGLHIGYSGQLVFAAPISGVQKDSFQTSAAVLGTWKYGVQKPTGLKYAWHRINPGMGIHVAALNQGNATAETGLGFSISLGADLITGGYGWNVAIQGSPRYYFIGVGLLELLQRFRGITNPNAASR